MPSRPKVPTAWRKDLTSDQIIGALVLACDIPVAAAGTDSAGSAGAAGAAPPRPRRDAAGARSQSLACPGAAVAKADQLARYRDYVSLEEWEAKTTRGSRQDGASSATSSALIATALGAAEVATLGRSLEGRPRSSAGRRRPPPAPDAALPAGYATAAAAAAAAFDRSPFAFTSGTGTSAGSAAAPSAPPSAAGRPPEGWGAAGGPASSALEGVGVGTSLGAASSRASAAPPGSSGGGGLGGGGAAGRRPSCPPDVGGRSAGGDAWSSAPPSSAAPEGAASSSFGAAPSASSASSSKRARPLSSSAALGARRRAAATPASARLAFDLGASSMASGSSTAGLSSSSTSAADASSAAAGSGDSASLWSARLAPTSAAFAARHEGLAALPGGCLSARAPPKRVSFPLALCEEWPQDYFDDFESSDMAASFGPEPCVVQKVPPNVFVRPGDPSPLNVPGPGQRQGPPRVQDRDRFFYANTRQSRPAREKNLNTKLRLNELLQLPKNHLDASQQRPSRYFQVVPSQNLRIH